jgi:GTP-binding protein
MFIDLAQVVFRAGDGGNGKVSFRQEKFIDRGGPDGGDGGNGGNVVLMASRNQNTLANFRFQKTLQAEHGQAGSQQKKHGKTGANLVVPVPVGTVILNEDGIEIGDLPSDGASLIVAKGGKGGFGNAHFISSVRQAPKIAEKGEQGEMLSATLELRMIADVGLIGLPNAGKSTLLSVVSNAKPEIANYPFTTLTPNLGVVDVDKESSLLFADIPGLIEGASKGKGLGDEFLRHVERTSVLVHLIDVYEDDIVKAYNTIRQELKEYRVDLSSKPSIVVLTKIEGLDAEILNDRLAQLQPLVPAGTPLMAISAQSKQGLKELLYELKTTVVKQRKIASDKVAEEVATPVYRLQQNDKAFYIDIQDETTFVVTGQRIEKFAARTDFDNEEGVRRIRDIMKKMYILKELERKRIKPGDTIVIGRYGQFIY